MILNIYDHKFPLEIQCDVTQEAIGYSLMQHKKPLSYSSRALTETEIMGTNRERIRSKNYTNIRAT